MTATDVSETFGYDSLSRLTSSTIGATVKSLSCSPTGMRVQHSTQGASTLYFHKDHLGSISTITKQNGAVVERLSYDP